MRSIRFPALALCAALAVQKLPDFVQGMPTKRPSRTPRSGKTKNKSNDKDETAISFGVELKLSNIRCDQVAQCMEAVSNLSVDSRADRKDRNPDEDPANSVLEVSMCRALHSASSAYGAFSGPVFTDCLATGATIVTSCPEFMVGRNSEFMVGHNSNDGGGGEKKEKGGKKGKRKEEEPSA